MDTLGLALLLARTLSVAEMTSALPDAPVVPPRSRRRAGPWIVIRLWTEGFWPGG